MVVHRLQYAYEAGDTESQNERARYLTRTGMLQVSQGKHTTVSSAILQLPWGELADSPGVRDYAPPVVPVKDVQHGYVEIAACATACRFQDCIHVREPQCAVQAAVTAGEIDARRYESYRRLRQPDPAAGRKTRLVSH